MGHVDKRDADFLLQVDELDLHFLAQLGVECRQRLIQEQHRRMSDQCAADGDALLLAAGEFMRIALSEADEAHVLEGGLYLGRD